MAVHAWDGLHTRVVAKQLQLAIEGVMEVLFPWSSDVPQNFCWHIIISYRIATDTRHENFPLHLMKRQESAWKADFPELEALVGLWAWSHRGHDDVHPSKINARLIALDLGSNLGVFQSWNDIWIQQTSGSYDRPSRPVSAECNADDTQVHRFFGYQAVQQPAERCNAEGIYFPTQNDTLTMCAQDIFVSFLVIALREVESRKEDLKESLKEKLYGSLEESLEESLEKRLKKRLESLEKISEGKTEAKMNLRTDNDNRRRFQLKNSSVEDIVGCFERSGLGSRQDAYMCIIPTLRWATKTFGRNEGLHLAVNGNYDSEVRVLVKNGADINAKNKEGLSALHVAVMNGYEKVVGVLLNEGADVEAKNKEEWTVLHAAVDGSPEIVRVLIKHGADIQAKTPNGWTTLHLAAERGYKEMIRVLHQEKADMEARTEEGLSALHIAVGRGKEEVIRELVEIGVDLKADVQNGWTVLHLATDGGYREMVKLFVDQGADINAKNQDGCTALHLAAEKGNKDMVNVLLEKRADVNLKDEEGKTALHFAALNGDKGMAQVLIASGADINAKDKKASTALQLAVDGKHEELEKELLEHGATTTHSPQGETREDPATQTTTRDHVTPAAIRSATTSMRTITVPCHHIRIGDLLILQGRPCQVIRIRTSSQTGQHSYLGVDLFTKQLHEESSFISNPAPSVVVQNMLGPVFKQYRALDMRDDGRVVAMTESGGVERGLPVLDQSGLIERLTKAINNNGHGNVRLLVINDNGMELVVDYKVVHGYL
jgi:ankyrin repeat protein